MVGGERPLLREKLAETDPPIQKNANFQSIFASSAWARNTPVRSGLL